jgi:hypothetical protein
MKKLLTTLLILAALSSFAQDESEYYTLKKPLRMANETTIGFDSIVLFDSITKDVLFESSRSWIAEAYKSAPDVIKYESKENGDIIVKGIFYTFAQAPGLLGPQTIKVRCDHTIRIRVKDGKARLQITDFSFYQYNPAGVYNGIYIASSESTWSIESMNINYDGERVRNRNQFLYDNTIREAEKILSSYFTYVGSKKEPKKDDW